MVAGDRTVYANSAEKNELQGFVTNRISNTKYTALTFIPKTLLEQFRWESKLGRGYGVWGKLPRCL